MVLINLRLFQQKLISFFVGAAIFSKTNVSIFFSALVGSGFLAKTNLLQRFAYKLGFAKMLKPTDLINLLYLLVFF